jgi:RecA-family ATPase
VDIDRLRLEISSVRPDLTVLDPLASFLRGDENSAQAMGAVVRVLRGMRDEFGTGFAIVHHIQKTKDGETTRGGERMRGSSAFYAAAEVGLWVKRVDGEQPRSNVRAELKDGEATKPFQVLFEPELGVLQYIDPYSEALDSFLPARFGPRGPMGLVTRPTYWPEQSRFNPADLDA